MRSRWHARFALALALVALGPLVATCAGVPEACRPVCEADADAEPCQQCLEEEKQKRAEERRQREEERRQAPPAPNYPSGGGGGGGYGGY